MSKLVDNSCNISRLTLWATVRLQLMLSLYCFILAGCSLLKRSPSVQQELPPAKPTLEEMAAKYRQGEKRRIFASVPAEKLPAPQLDITPSVRREMDIFLNKGRAGSSLRGILQRREELLPLLKEIFDDEGIPIELLALAMVESGFNPEARSPAGAVGLWQFMRSTARLYGLIVNDTEDQRKDPVLSTIAAARHLRDLYSHFRDWYLALAAYNAGVGAIDRILTNSATADYWNLCKQNKLSKQTIDFVPRFIAYALIANKAQLLLLDGEMATK